MEPRTSTCNSGRGKSGAGGASCREKSGGAVSGSKGGIRLSVLADPGLSPPEQRNPDESANQEFLAAVVHPQFAPVHSPAFRVENVSAHVLVSGPLHLPN